MPTKTAAAQASGDSVNDELSENLSNIYVEEDVAAAHPFERSDNALYNTAIRHGFAETYASDQYMSSLAEVFFIYFEDKRHETGGNPKPGLLDDNYSEWRIRDRQRTVNAAIVLCLNIGVDPPDVIKTQPCARLEAWIDPTASTDPKKAIEQIGKHLQAQYEVLSTRTKYKLSLDPNVEDCKKFCMSLRRSARDERILFHYNGHGVPRPTPSGEIWVFNRGYTQYIPVSVYDLQSWLGAPCIFCYDCNGAGHIVNNFNKFVQKRKQDEIEHGKDPTMPPAASFDNCIQLAACRDDETLPMNPDLPADLFTCCITSPIEIALKWFVLQSPYLRDKFSSLAIPGKITDRRTPLGELNWIFTAITDTIAWSTLDGSLFKRLFRQDLVVAAMFRNFLLAVRIMKHHNCHPVSSPELPDTSTHPMWDSWDLAVDQCLAQLPALQAQEKNGETYKYQNSTFFEQQLTAFEMWLKYRSSSLDEPPEQLPVLLQVLLSQIHRLRALILLSKYLDLGPKAVQQALSIGIFPYVLKLLQSPAPELKPVLVFIWARIMAVDYKNIQHELVKENGYRYFTGIFIPQQELPIMINTVNVYEHLAMCAFVTSLFCNGYPQGQRLCLDAKLLNACADHLNQSESPLLKIWTCLLLSQLWDEYPDAKQLAATEKTCYKICPSLEDPVPEVRTACVVALTTFIGYNLGGSSSGASYPDEVKQREIGFAMAVLSLTNDASSIVRREVVVFLSKFVKLYLSYFLVAAFSSLEEEVALLKDPQRIDAIRAASPAHGTIFITIWRALLVFSEDPYIEVAEYAQDVTDYVMMKLDKTPLAEVVARLEAELLQFSKSSKHARANSRDSIRQNNSQVNGASVSLSTFSSDFPPASNLQGLQANSRTVSQPSKAGDGHFFENTFKRSISFANSLKSFAWSATGGDNNTPNSTTTPLKGPSSVDIYYGVNSRENKNYYQRLSHNAGKKPKPVRYRSKDYSQKIVLPLKSGFFDWCCEYFQEPQMTGSESDEPGSERYIERLWRKGRNEQIINETQVQKDMAVQGSWNVQTGFLANGSQPAKLLFSQYESHLVVCDENEGVTIWDWSDGVKLNKINNGNPMGSRVTDAKFLNEDDQPLLLTGSSDGVVKIYRNYENQRSVKLTCAWRVLTDLKSSNRTSGLVSEWQQSRGTLLVSGDVKVIRVWDAPREVCVFDMPCRADSPVTALTSDQVAGHCVVSGFGDGTVRVYDRRIESRNCLVKVWKNHDSWIVNARMQRGGARELVTASTDGKINLWDIRAQEPVLSFQSELRGGIRCMDVHEHAPVISAGYHSVSVWSTLGSRISTVKPPSTSSYMLSSHHAPYVSALTFHPHRMIMGVSNMHDHNVSIFTCARTST